jgi:hypothetical protein
MSELQAVGSTLSAHEHAAAVAQHGQHAMFGGQLASTIMSAARHVFLPDMATQHIEWAKSILVGGERCMLRGAMGGTGGGGGGEGGTSMALMELRMHVRTGTGCRELGQSDGRD